MKSEIVLPKTKRMEKILLSGLVLVTISLGGATAFALDPMGPSSARLKEGQYSAGADYAFGNMDFEANGRSILTTYDSWSGSSSTQTQKQRIRLNGIDVSKTYASFGYGITDGWDVFLRAGTTNIEWQDDGDSRLSMAFGTRTTFYRKGNLSLGASAQFSLTESEYDSVPLTTVVGGSRYSTVTSGKLRMQETQIAIGPTYDLTKSISIYGGASAFFHVTDGKLTYQNRAPIISIPEVYPYLDNSYRIDEISVLGGYIGTEIRIRQNLSYSIEYQYTEPANVLGMSLVWRF